MTFTQKFYTARSKGLRWCLFCKVPSFALRALQLLLPFDEWHADNPSSCRPYKRFVADLVSSLKPKVVVEVGCGIGDIIEMVNAEFRFGFDLDRPAIAAAHIVHPFSKVLWSVGDLNALDEINGQIDVLLAIGWLHVVSPEYFKSALAPHLSRIRYVIVDRFNQWESPPYLHDFSFIGDLVMAQTPKSDPIREYLVYCTSLI